ncbi:MAG: hypothetical protein ACI9BW_001022 [Gammaproteobacteria bacterium]|jgi:hypothetical protein
MKRFFMAGPRLKVSGENRELICALLTFEMFTKPGRLGSSRGIPLHSIGLDTIDLKKAMVSVDKIKLCEANVV